MTVHWKIAFLDHVCDRCGKVIKDGTKYALSVSEVWNGENDTVGDWLINREHGECHQKFMDDMVEASKPIYRMLAEHKFKKL